MKSALKSVILGLLIGSCAISGTGCKSDWKERNGENLLIYFDALTNTEMRSIDALTSSFADHVKPRSVTQSMASDKVTIRMSFSDPKEFRESGKLEDLRKAIEEVKKPTVFTFTD